MGEAMHGSPDGLHKTPQLRIVNAGPYSAAQGKDFPLHRDGTWEIIYYREGAIESIVGGEVHPGHPGAVVAIPPRMPHWERAITAYSNYWIQIDAPMEQPWPRLCYDDENGSIGHVCEALVREWRGLAPERARMIRLLVDQLDILLRRMHEQAGLSAGERLVREAERLLQERFHGHVAIAEVAQEIGVSPSFLRVLFVRHRGRTPMTFLQAIRVQHALGVIRNSSAPLEAIADACGYHSASHLSRHVKRATGQSPGTLRSVRS